MQYANYIQYTYIYVAAWCQLVYSIYMQIKSQISNLAVSIKYYFNHIHLRINIEVLSVVAQQILSILSALAAGYARFVFECREINLVSTLVKF